MLTQMEPERPPLQALDLSVPRSSPNPRRHTHSKGPKADFVLSKQHPCNFITMISLYNKVINIPNSMTILDELLSISVEIAKRNLRGIWNFPNPGVVSHNEILEMYKDYIDPDFKWVYFTLEEQAKMIVAPRINILRWMLRS
ncbi:hypothetical protein MLD38_025905 [Melastoma candidum]|uniref:Uncharacterized protein n=1 Tax=Melastoma candidum TaxID=119954 RepID=A0ACB9P217_9MYRT|nr:hypothetical protein MLD38_025905 [Melastoma candidum]